MSDDLLLDFRSPCGSFTLTFEDDGKVAYAYLKREGAIVGDVWLYNRCPTPSAPEWSDPRKIPFANPLEYVTENARIEAVVGDGDILVDWEGQGDEVVAYVYLFEDLIGVVGVGDKPGYARFAAKDGPLAQVMEIV